MNILFFDSIDEDIFGGLENWVGMVASRFVRKGHNVTVAGRPNSEFLRRISQLDDKIDIFPVKISGDFNPVTIARIKKLLRERDIHIVFVNFNKDIRLAGLAARWYGRSRVVWRVGLNITKDNIVHRFLTPRLIDGVITPSHSLKREITHYGYITPGLVQVVHNGTLVKEFARPDADAHAKLREKYNLSPGSTIAVTVGRFVNHKGHAYLIEAAPEIVEKHPDIVFMFIGDGYMKQPHQQRIAQLNLEKHFVFTGMLDEMDLELAGSDLVIHPSIIEPFSNAILECMRAGLPVVATRVGGTEEALVDGESAYLIEPGDSKQLAAAVVKMLNSPQRLIEMGLAGQKKWRGEFTVDIMLNKVEQYLARFVN
ncbi:MAG: glycosyltransferase family 4 protein [Candidatus Zixiibacteriota bacterium]|nr:MAG: glycosyltransferase family 4 protein [candidate division Zixibacteria bacterium]